MRQTDFLRLVILYWLLISVLEVKSYGNHFHFLKEPFARFWLTITELEYRAFCVRKTWRSFLRLQPQMSNLSQSVKGKMIFWRLDPLWSPGCPNPRVESNDAKLIFIFVLFNKYYCVLSKNFVTYSTATQIYISTTSKTAMTTSGKISKNIQFQNTHAGFTTFSVHSQHLKSSSSAFRPALSNLWLLLVLSVS